MKEDIEQYSPKQPEVVAIGGHRVRAFVGDQAARLGDVLWVRDEPTRIVALAGARRVEAIAFDTSTFAVGDAVRVSDEVAGWPAPPGGEVMLDQLRFVPGRVAESAVRSGAPTALELGIPLDEHLPIVAHGVTLVLDTGASDERFDALYRLVMQRSTTSVAVAGRSVPATHNVVGSNGLALAVAAEWARELGDCLIIEAEPFDLDELLDPLRGVTVLVRVKLRDGLEILAESLDLGHCDTQLLLRPDGSLDLTRSESRHTDTATRFGRLGEVREQLAIFGEHEIEATDAALLERADRIERHWIA